MSDLERDLRESLRRREPPDGFAERVLARVQEADTSSESSPGRFWGWRWAAAAAAIVLVLFGGFALYRERQQRAENERAKEQLLYALRVTGSQVRYVQQRLSEMEQRTFYLSVEPE